MRSSRRQDADRSSGLLRSVPRALLMGSAAVMVLAVVATVAAARFSAPARAGDPSSCNGQVTSAPTGPATVSATSSSFGQVLVVGSGDYTGCSLYLLTTDRLHRLVGSNFACSAAPPVPGSCDTFLWPALLTDGAPIAGPGVNPHLLGTVTRSDLPGLGTVQQVTYAGMPLYRFFLDETAGETDGANLFDPATSPTGIWYLVDPAQGLPAPGQAHLGLETAPLGGNGADETVLSVSMDPGLGGLSYPVYTLSPGHGDHRPGRARGPRGGGPCRALCSMYWPPVLTSGQPAAGSGVDRHALGTIRRPDGSRQITYKGRPLYLFANDAYLPPPFSIGIQGIFGAGVDTLWGEFNTIPRSP